MTSERIGRYELRSELGRGGMAVVYLAFDPQVKRQVAVKVLPRQYTFDPQFRLRFQQEAEVIAALEHPAIIPIHDFGEYEDQPYIVMRYMAGGSLAGRLERGPLPIQDIVRIVARLAPALDEAHERGILHRDLKPGNILFDQRGEAYIADFGIAKLAESSAAFTGSAIIGTPAYMSPEQARGRGELDGRSDIYSLGVILFEMLTGKLPFEADTPMGLAMAHVSELVPDVRDLRGDLPESFSAILARTLAKDRVDRYRTAGELAEALDTAARGIIAPSWESPSAAAEQPPTNRPLTLTREDAPAPRILISPTRTLHEEQAGRRATPTLHKPRWRSWILWSFGGGLLLLGAVAAVGLYILPLITPPAATPTSIATATLRIHPSSTSFPPQAITTAQIATATSTRTPTAVPAISSWEIVGAASASDGGISNNLGQSEDPSIAIAPDGMLYVSWTDGSGGETEIYVRSWDGSEWQEVGTGSASGGGISNINGSSVSPSLAIAADGTPYVFWSDNGGSGGGINSGFEIYVRSWDGSGWREVGAGSASGGGVSITSGGSEPSLAISPDGTPYIAWSDDSNDDSEIYIRSWDGRGWREIGLGSASGGGISNTAGFSGYPSVAIAPDGTLYIAWWDTSSGDSEIYVRSWDGSGWREVGDGSASGGGISNTAGFSGYPSLAISPDGTLYVAWSEGIREETEIFVRSWDGGEWREVGAGSASGGGISNTTGFSSYPSLAIAPDGMPYVSWSDGSGGETEIYVRSWDGNGWREAGAGSASGGGISNTTGFSGYPSLAIAADGTPYIVWWDDSSGNPEIYVRFFDPSE